MLKKILLTTVLTLPLTSCLSTALEYVEERTQEVKEQFDADMEEAQTLFRSGEISQAEYKELVDQAKALAEAELATLPKETSKIIKESKEYFEARGKSYGYTLLQLLLGVFLGGGAAAGSVGAVSRRKRNVALATPPEED